MQIEGDSNSVDGRARIDLWLFSSAISSLLFALAATPLSPFVFIYQFLSMVSSFIFYLALLATYSVALLVLYFPFVLYFKDAEGRHFWITLASGALIGPACLTGMGLVSQWRGGNVQRIWVGDGLDTGILVFLPWMFGCSFTTSFLYVMALRSRTRDRRVSAQA